MRSSEKNPDRAGNETDADDPEEHLHERLFDPPEYLHKESKPGDEHRQGNQNVCVQHANPRPIVFSWPDFSFGAFFRTGA
jgi:hypothetical protein